MDNIERKSILISGASGSLGKHLVYRLLEEKNNALILLSREGSIFCDKIRNNKLVKIISYKSFFSLNSLDDLKIETFIHLATLYKHNERASELIETNILLPSKIVEELCKTQSFKFLLSADTTLPKDLDFYSLTKDFFREWIKIQKNGIIKINIKLQNFYSREDNRLIGYIINNLSENHEVLMTHGNQKRDFVHMEDVINAFSLILCKKGEFKNDWNEFEVGLGKSYTIRELVKVITSIFGFNEDLIKWNRVQVREREPVEMVANIVNLQNLGWSPRISLEEGIKKLKG